MKQETFEEASEKYVKSKWGSVRYPDIELSFISGAKWQQENSNVNALHFEIDALKRLVKVLEHQQERSYSEEDMQKYAKFSIVRDREGVPSIVVKEWFEKYKKK
jgi:C4-type Zn-finger protein